MFVRFGRCVCVGGGGGGEGAYSSLENTDLITK